MINYRPATLLFSLLLLVACGENEGQREVKEDREQQREIAKEAIEAQLVSMEAQYNATRFGKEHFGASPYTYHIQTYFQQHKDRRHLFSGNIHDVLETVGGYSVIGEIKFGTVMDSQVIALKLAASNDMLEALERLKHTPFMRRYIDQHWIVSRIQGVEWEMQPNMSVAGDSDYVSGETTFVRRLTLIGELVAVLNKEQ
jgi:hypothetical protein